MYKVLHNFVGKSFFLFIAAFLLLNASCPMHKTLSSFWGMGVTYSGQQHALPTELALLEWPENLEAVSYKVEILSSLPQNLSPDQPANASVAKEYTAFANQLMLPLKDIEVMSLQNDAETYFRVRAFDLDGQPVGAYSAPKRVKDHVKMMDRNAPVPRRKVQDDNGSLLLYPVYAYTGNPGAAQYEVEVTDRRPENPDGTAPSKYRVFAKKTTLLDLYDEKPRIGTYYWRVRGLDEEGRAVGEWSLPQKFTTQPERAIKVGIYGDSISHGGGHLSFSPVDFAYSYSHYLDFPTVNLSESGDTSEMMLDRFNRDVAPFHLQYLLIMGGTNSLRAGVPAEKVIADLREMGVKAERHGIVPIYLTLPAINPENIEKAFAEPTDPDWRESFAEVNAFIRSQRHIDTAALFDEEKDLPTEMALDGIHGDWQMKQMMAGAINKSMKDIINDAGVKGNGGR